jgi:four helix bundle suffix protein
MTDLIAKHGGYQNLKSFQMSEIAYDFTFDFVKLYVDRTYKSDMTYKVNRQADQMLQAARSGKQNIAEGSVTSGTSKQSELRLVSVARASLEELKNDFLDFLRTHALSIWSKDDVRVLAIRNLAYRSNRSYMTYKSYLSDAESAANCILCVINQANYLLDQQLRVLEKDLTNDGDLKDRFKETRKKQMLNDGPDIDDFLKSAGLRRLENGRVVNLNDPD